MEINNNVTIALLSFIIDLIFGEFKFIKHPVIFMGDYIVWFEKKFYKNSIKRGIFLSLSLIFLLFIISYTVEQSLKELGIVGIVILGFIGSTTIANRMLFESVDDLSRNPQNIKYLVSRDTENMTSSEINRASIETYAENLSDGVIAPLLFMLAFGVMGAFIYKAVNTLDSMVGYRNEKYEKFGKFSAKLDDFMNLIPSRVTALIIALLFWKKEAFFKLWGYGKLHKSPNSGYPISAMALSINIKLGGDTSYFGKIEKKPYFGCGKIEIKNKDVKKSLTIFKRLNIFIVSTLFFANIMCF